MTTIPATAGEPYVVRRSGQLLVLDRMTNGKRIRVVFKPADAYAVADALVDAAESLTT